MITMADWRRNELKVKSAVLKNRKRTCTRQVPFACSPRILRNWHQRNRNAGLKEVTIFLLFPPPPPAFLFHLYWVLWSFSSLLAVNFSSEIRQVVSYEVRPIPYCPLRSRLHTSTPKEKDWLQQSVLQLPLEAGHVQHFTTSCTCMSRVETYLWTPFYSQLVLRQQMVNI